MQRVVFSASDVAALIGRHKYRTREAALLEILMRMKADSLRGISGLVSDAVLATLSDPSIFDASTSAQPEFALASIPGFRKNVADAAAAKKDVGSESAAKILASAAATAEIASKEAAALLTEATSQSELALAMQTAATSGVSPEIVAAAAEAREAAAMSIVKSKLSDSQRDALTEALAAQAVGSATADQVTLLEAHEEQLEAARRSADADAAACAAASSTTASLLRLAERVQRNAATILHRAQLKTSQAKILRSTDAAALSRALSSEVQVRLERNA